MIKKLALIAMAVFICGVAIPALATTGIYINGNLGYADKNTDSASALNFMSKDENHFAWNAFLGYNYDFNAVFGLGFEGGYADYGDTEWKIANIKRETDQTAIQLNAVATWHVVESFDFFGKIGIAFGKADTDYSPDFFSLSNTSYDTLPVLALGATYNITPTFGVQAMWEHLFRTGPFTDSNFDSVHAFMLGLKYTFEI